MGISDKLQVEGGLESEAHKWVIAGVSLRVPLRPINTKPAPLSSSSLSSELKRNQSPEVEDEEEGCSTTPTAEEARIPGTLPCPAAPRKRRPSSKCRFGAGPRDFFVVPPDLDSVFIRRVERAK